MSFERRMTNEESMCCFFNLLLYWRNDACHATLLTFYFIFTVQCRKFRKHVVRGFVKGEENIVLWFLRWFTRRLWDRLCSNASRRGSERCFTSTNPIPVNPYPSPTYIPSSTFSSSLSSVLSYPHPLPPPSCHPPPLSPQSRERAPQPAYQRVSLILCDAEDEFASKVKFKFIFTYYSHLVFSTDLLSATHLFTIS